MRDIGAASLSKEVSPFFFLHFSKKESPISDYARQTGTCHRWFRLTARLDPTPHPTPYTLHPYPTPYTRHPSPSNPRGGHYHARATEVRAWDARDQFHRGESFQETRFRGYPIRYATTITTHLLWDVTGSFTCVAVFVEKSCLWETLAAMKLDKCIAAPDRIALKGVPHS